MSTSSPADTIGLTGIPEDPMNTHGFKNTHWTRCPITGPAELFFAEAALRQLHHTTEAVRADMLEYYHRRGMEVPQDLRTLLHLPD